MTTLTIVDRSFAGEADLEPIAHLLNTCSQLNDLDDTYSVDALRVEFAAPDLDAQHDLRVWHDADGKLIGFGQIWLPVHSTDDTELDGFLYFRMDDNAPQPELADAIVGWGEQRVREVAAQRGLPAVFRSAAREQWASQRAVFERHGMQPERYFFRMMRPLDQPIAEPTFPAGLVFRTTGKEEYAAWVEAYNQSFIDHYNFHPSTVETHVHWLSDKNYAAERDLVAVTEDGTIAAFAFCWIDPDDNQLNNRKVGWINLLGVRRGFRKIGLGKAMLLAALTQLAADGMTTAKLGVDAENPTGALQLYESVGFVRESASVQYTKKLV